MKQGIDETAAADAAEFIGRALHRAAEPLRELAVRAPKVLQHSLLHSGVIDLRVRRL